LKPYIGQSTKAGVGAIVGVGVGVGVAVGAGLAVGVRTGEGVAVGVAVAIPEAEAVGVGVATPEADAEGVGLAGLPVGGTLTPLLQPHHSATQNTPIADIRYERIRLFKKPSSEAKCTSATS
jgi:hypothetical protein